MRVTFICLLQIHLLLKYGWCLFAPSATTASATQRCKCIMQTTHFAYPGYPWFDPWGNPQEGYWYDYHDQVWQPSKYRNQVWPPGIGTSSSSQCAWQPSMASGQPAPQMVPSQPHYTRDALQTDILQPSDGRTSSGSSRHAPSASNRSRSRAKSQEGDGQEGQEGEPRRRKRSRPRRPRNRMSLDLW